VTPLPLPDPPLSDGVIGLRQWRLGDAPVVASWGDDELIARYSELHRGFTVLEAQAAIARQLAAWRDGRGVYQAIVDLRDRLLGAFDPRLPGDDREIGEIGYLVAGHARGQGVASRAIWLGVSWAFTALGLGRVQALVAPGNDASVRALERVGFAHEGLLRAYRPGNDGPREDRLILAVLPGELRRPFAPSEGQTRES
jgi:RimJ/RimL family protein N-acetyltransferase